MKFLLLSFLLFFFSYSFGQDKSIGFIENKGQIVDEYGRTNFKVVYLLNTNGLNVQLRKEGFSYDVYEPESNVLHGKSQSDPIQYNFHRIDIDFLNSNPDAVLKAEGKSADYDHYYTNPAFPAGVLYVHKYNKIVYQDIYPAIDVVFFIPQDKEKPVEYNFIIRPGGNISDIKLKFGGAKTRLAGNKIKMNLRFGTMEEVIPLSWEEDKSGKKETTVFYKKTGNNTYGFIGDTNKNKILVIDPVPIRLWGTYYGGSGSDYPLDLATGPGNTLHISGKTSSPNNIATTGTYPIPYFLYNGFIAKFDTDGNRLWGIYYSAFPEFIRVDANANVYFTGSSSSTVNNVTTPGSHQPVSEGLYDNAFLVKLDASGVREWGTFFGGESTTKGRSICFDNNNNVYLAGTTDSHTHVSIPGVHQEQHGSAGNLTSDGFLAKFTPSGVQVWGTYYGGDAIDEISSCVFAEDNHIYLSGNTHSTNNIATPGAYQAIKTGSISGFIAKITPEGQRVWGTYFGGGAYITLITNAVLADNYLYFFGITDNTNLNSTGTFNPAFQNIEMNFGRSAYVVKFDVQTQSQAWGTYFQEYIQDIAVNENHFVYLTGSTDLDDGIATPGSFLEQNTSGEGYIIKLNTIGERVWGTYYGGNQLEDFYGEGNYCNHVALDTDKNIYVSGDTWLSTSGIATPGAHQTTRGDSYRDGFLMKFQDCQTALTADSNSPLCVGSDILLTASGGTDYLWTGPDNFSSTLQNPTLPNAQLTNSGMYTCTITGTGDCDNTFSINVSVGDTIAPVPDIASLPTITGDCNAISVAFPTATDNCSGAITATTASSLAFTASGTYTISWVFTDANNNVSSQEQTVVVTAQPLPVVSSQITLCHNPLLSLQDITVTGQNLTWYDAETGGAVLANSTHPANGTTYYVSQTINGCESQRTPVTVSINNIPAPTGVTMQNFCINQNAVLDDFVVIGENVVFYDQQIGGNILSMSATVVNGASYWASQTVNGCESTARLQLTANIVQNLPANDYEEFLCDELNNNSEIVDLRDYNTNLISGTGNYTFTYYALQVSAEAADSSAALTNFENYNLVQGENIVYVRIQHESLCHKVVQLKIIVNPSPEVNIDDEFSLCRDNTVTITAPPGYSYEWSTGSTAPFIKVASPGNYWLTLQQTSGGITCSSTKNFTVQLSDEPAINIIEINDWTESDNTINVLVSGNGNYDYSIDGTNYQSNNQFSGLPSGRYTVFVRDECGVASKEVLLLMYPRFFTPNSDGTNDLWRIPYSSWEPGMTIKIFDRFGKLLKELKNYDAGWDGTYNGHSLPSTDYWFLVKRADNTEHKGHFTLKR